MFHISGTIGTLAILGRGGQQIVPAVNEPDALLDVAARLDATTTLVLPPMLAALAAAQRLRPRPLPSLRMITHGGGPITDAEVSRAHAAFPQSELVHLYGATELSPIATVLRGEEFLVGDDRGRSCGRAIGNVAIEIRDSSGTEVAVGQFGEVVVRGATVMAGYWNRPDISEEVIDDGWYRTGDIGRLDEDGYLYVVDRTADVIRRGDRMVFSTTVERALCAIEGVWEAAVLPDDNNGFYAVVVVNDANAIADCRRALAGFGVPWKIATRSEPLPRSGAGKVLKRLLRDPDR
jgi:acyl-CoA synthetase (AMP-forming)/AMP-acid ligase II